MAVSSAARTRRSRVPTTMMSVMPSATTTPFRMSRSSSHVAATSVTMGRTKCHGRARSAAAASMSPSSAASSRPGGTTWPVSRARRSAFRMGPSAGTRPIPTSTAMATAIHAYSMYGIASA